MVERMKDLSHRRRKRGGFGGAIIINRRRAHAQGYNSCVADYGASVHPENAVTYSAGNGGQTICGGFSETAPLQRSNTPSLKAIRTVDHFPAESAHAHYALIVRTWRPGFCTLVHSIYFVQP